MQPPLTILSLIYLLCLDLAESKENMERVLSREADLTSRRNASKSNKSLAPIYADIMVSLLDQPVLLKETVLDDPRSLDVFNSYEMSEIAEMIGYSLRTVSMDFEQSRANSNRVPTLTNEPRNDNKKSVIDGAYSSSITFNAMATSILISLTSGLLNLAQLGGVLLMDIIKRAVCSIRRN